MNKIHQELEIQLKDELNMKLIEEINYIKKKESFNQKLKMEQIDNEIKEKVKNEFEEELNRELILKEKEIKIKYNQKLENFRKKFKNELNEEYEKKKKEMKNQLNDIKSKIYRSRCSEKIKINKINKMKKNIGNYNEKNNMGIKKIDKILGNESDEEYNDNNNEGINNFLPPSLKNNNDNDNDNEYYMDDNFNEKIDNENNNRNNFNNYNNRNEKYINNESNNIPFDSFKNTNKMDYINDKKLGDNSVNLAELNKRIKESTDKISKNSFTAQKLYQNQAYQDNNDTEEINNINDIDNNFEEIYNFQENDNIKKEINNNQDYEELNQNLRKNNYIEKYDYNNNIQKENISQVEKNQINNVYNKPRTNMKTTYNFGNNKLNNVKNIANINKYKNKEILKKNSNDFIFDKNKNIFYSLQINSNIPTNISDFGKFLIYHIENEENYKILFYRELKSFKLKIKKIFSKNNSTDHCLTDYLLDMWEKIEVSFYTRYQILKNIIKLNANDLYFFLDRETEYLTNYFQITEKIFEEIKKRENIKAKLQAKSNRNEVILEEDKIKLDEITQNLEENIKMFKNNYEGMNIVWKGIYYEWFMNYEKWFYEMEIRNDFDDFN